MRHLVLIISCLLLMLFSPMERLELGNGAINAIEECLSVDKNQESVAHDSTADILYDNDDVVLLNTFDSGNDDVIPFRMNQWGQHWRVLSARLQMRYSTFVLHIKKQIHLLSSYLTTLINHISQFYSSLHLLCWQYAADCYVFAFRQIII